MAKKNEYIVRQSELSAIATAIKMKSGNYEPIQFSNFATAIDNLTAGSSNTTSMLLKPEDFPEYLRPEALEIARKVNQVREAKSIVFIAMSDNHYQATQNLNHNNIFSTSQRNNASTVFANQAAKTLAYILDIDFFAHMGDTCTGAANTVPSMITTQITEMLSYFKEARSDLPVFLAIGNHDNGYYYHNSMFNNRNDYNTYKTRSEATGITDKERETAVTNANKAAKTLIDLCPDVIDLNSVTTRGVKNIDTSGMEGKDYRLSGSFVYDNFTKHSYTIPKAMGNIENGGYCYRDFSDKKLRVFLLNTSEGLFLNPPQDSGATTEQKLWWASKLQELPSDWQFIVLCHYPLDYGGDGNKTLSRLLAAYLEQRDIVIGETTCKFSETKPAKFIAQFHGHIHNFLIDQLHDGMTASNTNGTPPPTYKAYRIAIPNAQFKRENYYYNEDDESTDGTRWGIKFFEGDFSDKGLSAQWNKTGDVGKDSDDPTDDPYDKNSTSFVVNVINPSEQKIYSFTYGAGPVVREVAYDFDENKFKYLVHFSSHDNSVSNSNIDSIVFGGGSYNTTLIPREGYLLDKNKISIKMGEKELKDDPNVFNIKTGKITISPISDDITISATTDIAEYYTVIYELTNVSKSPNAVSKVYTSSPIYDTTTFNADDDLFINPYLTKVTMGGTNVPVKLSSNRYQIKIDNVTGPIVIHIEAYASNLWKFAENGVDSNIYNNGLGYVNNRYLGSNTTLAYDKEQTGVAEGYVTTGYIPYFAEPKKQPETITIKGIVWSNEEGNKSDADITLRAYAQNVDKVTKVWIGAKQSPTYTEGATGYSLAESFDIVEISPGEYQFTPKMDESGQWAPFRNKTYNLAYIRFSLKCENGQNLYIDAGTNTDIPEGLYDVVYNTGHLKITNAPPKTRENEPYETQILDTVRYILDGDPIVKMDNTILTDAWIPAERKIYIENVTGNIEITANEIEIEPNYTDLVTTGYTRGRLKSDGTLEASSSSEYITTDYIKWTVDSTKETTTIRIGSENNTILFKDKGNARITFYDADQNPIDCGAGRYTALQGNWMSDGIERVPYQVGCGALTDDEGTACTVIINNNQIANADSFRLCAVGNGEDLIVTLNERIS